MFMVVLVVGVVVMVFMVDFLSGVGEVELWDKTALVSSGRNSFERYLHVGNSGLVCETTQ